MVFDDLFFDRRAYDAGLAYGQSKTAQVLFAVEATRRWAADGITANALMPGGVWTRLQRHWDPETLAAMQAQVDATDARTGRQDPRAGRGHVGDARVLARSRRHRRALLRGLPGGRGR